MKPKYFTPIFRAMAIIFLLTLIFGRAPVSFAQSSQNWSEPLNLSNSGSSTDPSLVVDLNGTIHVIWVDEFDGYKYTRSTDAGKSWTDPKTVIFPFSGKGNRSYGRMWVWGSCIARLHP